MSHLLICGAAGYTNLGDDAILWGMVAELRAALGEPVVKVAGGPELPRLVGPLGASPVSYDDRAELARAVEDADLVILGGGGMLYDIDYNASLVRFLSEPPDRQWLYELAKIATAARAAGRPVMGYGLGVGPLVTEAARKAALFIGEQAQAFTVRDSASADLLAECGLARTRVHVAADPSVSVEPSPADAAELFLAQSGLSVAPRPWITLNLRPWYRFAGVEAGPPHAIDQLIARAAEIVSQLVEHMGATVVLLPFQRLNDDDRKMLERVLETAGRPAQALLVDPPPSPPDLVAALARFDLMVGMRLHSLLLAANAGLPFVALPYVQKVWDLAAAMEMTECAHSPDDLDVAAVLGSCEALLNDRKAVAADVTRRRQEMKAASAVSAELAAALLETRAAPLRASARRRPTAATSPKAMRVLIQIRPDFRDKPGGDVVQLEEMLPYLRSQGAKVEITGEPEVDLADYDLVHTINLDRPQEPYQHCLNAVRQGKPVVLSTVHTDLTEFLDWGDTDYWDLPEPDKGHPTPRRAPAPHPIEVRRRAQLHLQRQTLIDWSTVYLPNAQVDADYLHRAFGMDLSRTVLVPNGAKPSAFEASPEAFMQRCGLQDFVLCVGRIEKKKNQLTLIAAMRGTGIPLVIVGRPNPQPYLDLCRRYADGSVHFIDSLTEEELASAYAAAKVHALASWIELPGLTTLEAAAAGCNIVSTDRGSAPEYLQDMAWYCDSRRVESVRDAVLAAHAAPRSDRLREHVRQRYHWRAAAERTLEGYRLALSLHAARPSADRQAARLAAAERHAEWLSRLAADLSYEVNVREAQVVAHRELQAAYQALEADRKLVVAELEGAQAELIRVTSRRLHRWSAAAARAGWWMLRALRIRP